MSISFPLKANLGFIAYALHEYDGQMMEGIPNVLPLSQIVNLPYAHGNP